MGFFPSEPPARRAGTPLDALCPPDVSPIDPPRRRALPTSRTEPWPEYDGFDTHANGSRPTSPSGLCSLRRSGTSQRRFRPLRARKLSWVFSSSGVYRSAAHPAFHARQLPWASRQHLPNLSLAHVDDGLYEAYDHGGWHDLSRDLPPLLRFPTLSRYSTVRRRARPELMVSLWTPSRVTALWQALCGSSRDDGSVTDLRRFRDQYRGVGNPVGE